MSIKPSSQLFTTLVIKMKEVMGNLDRDTVAKAYRRFQSRFEAVVAANGDFFNKMAFIFF
jgi:hypothetical protein